jgi:hypothetical protein
VIEQITPNVMHEAVAPQNGLHAENSVERLASR